jgi:hypothetical protein
VGKRNSFLHKIKHLSGRNGRTEDNFSRIIFFCSAIYCTFFLGFLFAIKQWPPYDQVMAAYHGFNDLSEHWQNDFGSVPTRHLVPVPASNPNAAPFDLSKAQAGLRIVSGFIPGRSSLFGAILLDLDGNELHYWPADYSKLSDHIRPQNTTLHGFEVFSDGSIIGTFDVGNSIAKFDACGKVLWHKEEPYHHVVSKAEDGSVWSWNRGAMVQLDPESGEVLNSIDLRSEVIQGQGMHGVFDILPESQSDELYLDEARHHMNDIEILSEALASSFPLFDAGDIMISLRNVNLVAVLDGTSHTVKWWRVGPWHRQHDPDFLPNGKISVFNNNMDMRESSILQIDPQTYQVEVVFDSTNEYPFYSAIRGKHQYLGNGNILISETQKGRAFEVTAKGEIVWEYMNTYDDSQNAVLSKAMLVPDDFFEADAFDCER